MASDRSLAERLAHERYPRAAAYDAALVLDSYMGPNVLWSIEELCQHLDLRSGMRVLDLGCGKALSSIFLAREFGVQVVALDLMTSVTENAARIEAAGLGDVIVPIRLDARKLPFAESYFDAVISIGAYMYVGTDDLYLRQLVKHLVPDGQLGIVVTGTRDELDEVPADMAPIFRIGFDTLHSPAWWRRQLDRPAVLDLSVVEFVEESGTDWARWLEVLLDEGGGFAKPMQAELAMFRDDADRRFGLIKAAGRVRPRPS